MQSNRDKEIECIKFFIPRVCRNVRITKLAIRKYFEWSERGFHKKELEGMIRKKSGFNSLVEGKRWRGIHVHELYERGILDGSVPYLVLLEGMPRLVVNFLRKEMFKGKDSELIEKIYTKLGYESTPKQLTDPA